MPEIIENHYVQNYAPLQRLSDYAVGVFNDLPSRKSVKKAITKNRLLIDGDIATTGVWVKEGMVISLLEENTPTRPQYSIDIPVVYEDEYLAVVNKPGGLSTSGNVFKSLENALPVNLNCNKDYLPRPVHRLDSATCGLVIVAKDKITRIKLGELLKSREVNKIYHAVVTGTPDDCGKIEEGIEGKHAETIYERIGTSKDSRFSLLKLSPLTGRTHQLRIHCSNSGFPIVGDKLYHGFDRGKGLFLCANKLEFNHPVTNEKLTLEIDLPRKFTKLFGS
ncbi:RluA family pseudouridine synthase [Mangrovivirga sp. M17]|uniref:RluA family pseudouridine synthase n=1 Tax=Mangrovivirga halotolerans TaxID=2993936 RepID=A0ABT3RMB0_9BACT|nr:RluA family pseudouridine synthase [Mangrovivirga halotolerans]MCX2742315.1 RluA family pseudouridine synthase [Mangrovivirga halotolerans]